MAEKSRKKKAPVSRARPVKSAASSTELSTQVAPDQDRAWKIAQLAATLAGNFDPPQRGSQDVINNPGIAEKNLDPYFAAVLKRAETLLSWAEGKWEDIHAYQLFEEGKILTAEKIADRFKEVSWEDIHSKTTVAERMVGIRQAFDDDFKAQGDFYDFINSGALALNVESALTAVFEESFGKPFEKLLPSIQGFVTRLVTMYQEIDPQEVFGPIHRNLYALNEKLEFLKWCFPDPREQKKATRADYLYRPHEIFRHCATRQWFSPLLSRSRTRLSNAFVPYPPANLQNEEFLLFKQAYEAKFQAKVAERKAYKPLPLVSDILRIMKRAESASDEIKK